MFGFGKKTGFDEFFDFYDDYGLDFSQWGAKYMIIDSLINSGNGINDLEQFDAEDDFKYFRDYDLPFSDSSRHDKKIK
ncbi:MAG: hypothetical protein ACOX7P_07035 [Oscillospiraceae bacterium]|jgi:hypothetical protein